MGGVVTVVSTLARADDDDIDEELETECREGYEDESFCKD